MQKFHIDQNTLFVKKLSFLIDILKKKKIHSKILMSKNNIR